MPGVAGIGANAGEAVGVIKQLVEFGSSLINPHKVTSFVGKVARPIRNVPDDVKDPGAPKKENEGKKDATWMQWILARGTWMHVLGVLGIIGTLVKPLFSRVLNEGEQPGFVRNTLDKIFNAASGIGLLVLGEVSFNSGWHLSGEKWLRQQGVLENVIETKKWRELEVEKHLAQGGFPMDVDDASRLLIEIRCSPKHNRATCFEGAQGNGKTLAAYITSFSRVKAVEAQGTKGISALQINAPQLIKVAQDHMARNAQMGELLPENMKRFISQDPLTYAYEEIENELKRGSVVVNDDAEYQLSSIDQSGFQSLLRITNQYGGSYIITIPKTLREVLDDTKLKDSDKKTILQRIDSISFPFENNRKRFATLDEGLQQIVTADLIEVYKNVANEKKEQFHQCSLREQQVKQWKGIVSRNLLDDGEKFGRTQGIGKVVSDYFTDEKINEIVSSYPMNPRYIELTIDSLSILLSNRKDKNVTNKDIDFYLKTILECDTFKNYVRSIDYRAVATKDKLKVTNTSLAIFESFRDHLERNLHHGLKEASGASYENALNLITTVFSKAGAPLETYLPRGEAHVGASCISRRDTTIEVNKLHFIYQPDVEIEGGYRVVFAINPSEPNKLYRGHVKIGVNEPDILTLTSVCKEGTDLDKVKNWIFNNA